MMNRKAKVFINGRYGGILEEIGNKKIGKYRFTYDKEYLADQKTQAVSLTLPKRKKPYLSEKIFPFFYGLLAEGRMKELQCRMLKIDENDHFGRLIETAECDSIGAVTVKKDSNI